MACSNCNCNCNCPATLGVCELTIYRESELGHALSCSEFQQNNESLEVIREEVCRLSQLDSTANCLVNNAPISYFWEPFCLFFDNLISQDSFTVPTGSLDPNATVKCVKVLHNGVALPPSTTVAATSQLNGFAYTVNGTDLNIKLDAAVGDPGAPCWIQVEGFARKSLDQITGCQ